MTNTRLSQVYQSRRRPTADALSKSNRPAHPYVSEQTPADLRRLAHRLIPGIWHVIAVQNGHNVPWKHSQGALINRDMAKELAAHGLIVMCQRHHGKPDASDRRIELVVKLVPAQSKVP